MKNFLNDCVLFQSDNFVILFIGFAFWFNVFVMCFGIYIKWKTENKRR